MKLKEKITSDMKLAMKARDKERTGVLRMILSELQYVQGAKEDSKEMSEDEVLKVVLGYHKRLDKGLVDFPEGEKREAVEAEIKIISEYLPKRAGPEEISKAIEEAISGCEKPVFGLLMKQVLATLGANVDGKLVSQLLKEKIAK